MKDIVERLRANAKSEDCLYDMDPELLNGAADEIERLRAELGAEIRRRYEGNRISSEKHREEVAQMQAERDDIARQLLYSEIGRQKANDEIEQMRDTFAAIKAHCEPQPFPLAQSIALTCSRYLMKPEDAA